MCSPPSLMYRRRFAALLVFVLCLGAARLEAQIPSFPGALGYGATATGGWALTGTNHTGGTVYHVTNLNDSGAGSFRTGVSTGGNIVVFDVGGDIQALSPISASSNVSIEGQTAPGGIQIFGSEVSFYGQTNIICRYVHFRDGTLDPLYKSASATPDSSCNAANLGNATNVIMDHCSFEFAAYNNVDAAGTGSTNDLTFQYCMFADPIAEQRFNLHIQATYVTVLDCLFANAGGRSPLAKTNMQYVNNIVYNFLFAITTGNSGDVCSWDVINNYFITGPSNTDENDVYYQVDSNQSAYSSGNYEETNNSGTLDGNNTGPNLGSATELTTYWNPATASLPTLSAQQAFYYANSVAGPVPRDQVDSQVVSQVLSLGKQGMLWGNQTATGLGNDGYGVITSGTALPDSDASGMPDDWKAAEGLSMTNPAAGEVTSPTGYTYLENYLAWKAQPNAWVAKNTTAQPTSVTIDLSQYTTGFATASSTYTVSNVIGGTATQSGGAPYLVTYVPTVNTSGLGGFNWSVGNGVLTMSSTCGILKSQSGPAQSVVWKGDGVNNYWDMSSSNWTVAGSGNSTSFGAGDPVTFNDTGSVSPAINIDTAVSPGSVTVNTYKNNYTLSGTGQIGGSGALVVEGTTSFTMDNSGLDSYSGGTDINGGTVYTNNYSAFGSGAITLNGGALVLTGGASPGNNMNVNVASTLGIEGANTTINGTVSGAAPLTLDFLTNNLATIANSWGGYTGTINVVGTGNIRLNNDQDWGFPAAVVNLNGANSLYNRSGAATALSIGALNGDLSSGLGGSDQGGSAGTTATYIIGSLNLPSTFAGPITNSTNQAVAITSTGTSILTLSGDSTYTGPTTVDSGTLLLTGTLGETDLSINSGATFISNTLVSGTVNLNQGSVYYIDNPSSAAVSGTFTTGAINVNSGSGSTLYYRLSSSPAGANDEILVNTTASDSLTIGGTANFIVTLTNGVLGQGTYYLIYGGNFNRNGTLQTNLVLPVTGVTRQTFGLGRTGAGTTPGFIDLAVTGNAASLTWTGTNGATWDLNTTSTDWSGASPSTFYDLDSVTFNDTDTNGSVVLGGTLDANVVYVTNNVTNYTFSGAGTLSGNTELVKSGTASLTVINTGNSFNGPIYLNAGTLYANATLGNGIIYLDGGTLQVENGTYLGNPIVVETTSTIYSTGGSNWVANNAGATLSSTVPVTLFIGVNGGAAFTVAGNMDGFQGTFEMGASAGLVRLDGDGSSQALFDIGTSTGTLGNRNGGITVNFGGLAGGSSTTLQGRQSGSGETTSTYVIGALNGNETFAGAILTGGDEAGLDIFKTGSGNWILSGTSTWVGTVLVEQGTLTISGSDNNGGFNFETQSGGTFALAGGTVTTDSVQIDNGAIFTAYGTLNSGLVNQGTATVTGPLTVNGDFENDGTLTVAAGGGLAIKLPAGGSTYVNNGTLTVDGSGSMSVTLPGDGSGSFVNNGLLDIMDSPNTALPAGYVNNGTILTSSLVAVQQFSMAGTTFMVKIQSYTGHTYQLQKSTNLTTWQNVGTAKAGATGTALTLTDTNASSAGTFYQIGVGP